MKKKLMVIVSFIFVLITVISCSGLIDDSTNNTQNNIVNNVTNEITNKVVNYEEITVEDLQTAVQTATKRVENASVGVSLKNVTSGSGYTESEDVIAIGTGVIYKYEEVKENGKLVNYKYYVMTNRHVITSDKYKDTKVFIYLGNEDKEIEATVLGYDNKVDIACLTFNHYTYIQPVEFSDSDLLEKGTFVIAVGNPGGYEYYGSVTFGVVSAPLRYLADDTDNDGTNDYYASYIQHDASINPGNSGGGLFTLDGKLIGINTLKIVQDEVDNMGFSIPSNQVKIILENYLEKGIAILRPTLGIKAYELKNMTPYVVEQLGLMPIPNIYEPGERQYGLYVNEFVVGGSLYNSGIKIHDIVLAIDDIKIKESSQLSALLNNLSSYSVGTEVKITYYSRSSNSIKDVTIILKK